MSKDKEKKVKEEVVDTKVKKKKQKSNIIISVIKYLVMLIGLIVSVYFIKTLSNINAIPNKFYILIIILLVILNVIGIVGLLLKHVWSKIISFIIYFVIIVLSLIGIKYGQYTIDFFDKSFDNNKVEVTTYDLIVLKDSSYNKVADLEGKKIGYIINDPNESKYLAVFKKRVTGVLVDYDNPYDLYSDLTKKKIDAFLVNEAYLVFLEEDDENFNDKIRIIDSFDIESKIEPVQVEKPDNSLKPINIYISGSDSRSSKIVVKSRSDVNMIMTINPRTKTVLLTSIPRDYYVQLAGTTGLKDKLTHSGIYGLEKSRDTVANLFDIDIDYTIKVGFNAIVELVDLVGGIDIESDRQFNSYHIKGWVVKKGLNHMDGEHALAYARERYAYKEGDNHRILNQQQVLEAVMKKIMTDKSILMKYDKLLDSFSNFYRTDITKEVVQLYVKDQLDTMSTWHFVNQTVKGKGDMLPTYTSPRRNLWVMIPDEDSVKVATKKINEVYNAK